MKLSFALLAAAVAEKAIDANYKDGNCMRGAHYKNDKKIKYQRAAAASGVLAQSYHYGSAADGAWYGSAHRGKCVGNSYFCGGAKAWATYTGYGRMAAQWLIFDFSKAETIDEVMIDHWGGQSSWLHAPKEVDVQIGNSMRGPWKTCQNFNTKTSCMPTYYPVNPCTGRYARLFMKSKHRNDSPYLVVDEVVFYGGAKQTTFPTSYPTSYPTAYPTAYPTRFPTGFPTSFPTAPPTSAPTADCPVSCELAESQRDGYRLMTKNGARKMADPSAAKRQNGKKNNYVDRQVRHHSKLVRTTHNVYHANNGASYTQHRCYRSGKSCVCECLDQEVNFQSGMLHGQKFRVAPRNDVAANQHSFRPKYYMPNQAVNDDSNRYNPNPKATHNLINFWADRTETEAKKVAGKARPQESGHKNADKNYYTHKNLYAHLGKGTANRKGKEGQHFDDHK